MKKGLLYFLLYASIVSILIISCKEKDSAKSNIEEKIMSAKGDTIIISENSPIKTKLNISAVTENTTSQYFTTTGAVRICSGGEADIASPYEGRITKSYVSLGEKVKANTPLFEITSPEYHQTVEDYLESQQQKDFAYTNYQRKKDLLDHGICSEKEYEEAETNYNIAEKGYEKTKASLKVFGVNPEKADINKPLTIVSPISGEIVKDEITVGQYLKADAEPVIIVASLDKVWVVARVKEKDLGKVKTNDFAQITTESEPNSPLEGKIIYIGNIMDEQTRSVEVYIDCPNKDRKLKANMFVTVGFTRDYNNQMVIPNTALLQENEKSYLFIAANNNTFIKREVIVASNGNNNSTVLSGLSSGEKIVMNGGLYLQ